MFNFFKSLFTNKFAKLDDLLNSGSGNTGRIYLDYASSEKVEDLVLEKFNQVSREIFGNASSIHTEGEKVKEIFQNARRRVARCIKARSHNVFFTSSTTEANNIFIKGVCLQAFLATPKTPANIVYSKSDHSAIIEPILWCKKFLERENFKINLVNIAPNKIGKILVEDVLKNLNENTQLICLSYVNSETGTIQEIKKISQAVKKECTKNNWQSPKIFVDATQSVKYFEIDVHNLGVDGISFGFTKLGGVSGAVLWVKDQTKLESIISGGGQEDGLRSGTENIPSIVANSYLLEKVCDRKIQAKNREYVYSLRNYLIGALSSPYIGEGLGVRPVTIFGDTKFKYNKFYEDSAPHILLLSIKDMLGEELCLRLDARGVAVSTATACSLLENSGSNFLKSINEPVLAKETIRVSLSEKNTKEEVDQFVEALKDVIHKFVK